MELLKIRSLLKITTIKAQMLPRLIERCVVYGRSEEVSVQYFDVKNTRSG